MHLIEQEPEETQANAYEGIVEVPRWHRWMEAAIRVAAVLTIIEFLFRLWPV